MFAGIYEIRNSINNKRYIGSSCDVERRLKEHRRLLIKGKHHSQALQNAFNSYGIDIFVFRILAILELGELLDIEQRLLDKVYMLGDNYNASRYVSAPMKGRKHTEVTKKLMVKSGTGRKTTPETKQLLSKIHKGRVMSAEWRAAISRGKTNPSDETRMKMSKARLGKSPVNKGVHRSSCPKGHFKTKETSYVYKDKWYCKECIKDCTRRNRLKYKGD